MSKEDEIVFTTAMYFKHNAKAVRGGGRGTITSVGRKTRDRSDGLCSHFSTYDVSVRRASLHLL
jgi:hypothetical protein